MIPALLATFFFACSAICGRRLSLLLGGISANFWRLVPATLLLWLMTLVWFPGSIRDETVGWYILSGVVGFGLGDVALFLAYPHLGARLTVLIMMSFGVLFGAWGDWWLLHSPLRWELAGGITVILAGLSLALHRPGEPLPWGRGLVFAVIAGWGQGFGAVLSRIAQAQAAHEGFAVPPIAQTAQRVAGGMAVALLAFGLVRFLEARRERNRRRGGHDPAAAALSSADDSHPPLEPRLPRTGRHRRHLPLWLAGSALCGPVIGVSAMQWSLQVLHSSALVVAITATAPLMIIPMARWIENETISPRARLGTALAVVGVGLTAFFR
jgi:drug/metabolite transporter (DMT)-like permease